MYKSHVTGQKGESRATLYLQQLGFIILERNFELRWGEIDIIAQQGDKIYFFEVKTRQTLKYGHPYHAVSPRKIRTIQMVATMYLTRHPELTYRALAVGVIGILRDPAQNRTTISHVILDK